MVDKPIQAIKRSPITGWGREPRKKLFDIEKTTHESAESSRIWNLKVSVRNSVREGANWGCKEAGERRRVEVHRKVK